MNNNKDQVDSSEWLRLALRLQVAADNSSPDPGFVYQFPSSRKEQQEMWPAYLDLHSVTVDKRIDEWILTGELPERNDPSILSFHVRFLEARSFVGSHVIAIPDNTDPDNPVSYDTVFAFPRISKEDLLSWLLKDWWVAFGIHLSLFRLNGTPES